MILPRLFSFQNKKKSEKKKTKTKGTFKDKEKDLKKHIFQTNKQYKHNSYSTKTSFTNKFSTTITKLQYNSIISFEIEN